MWLDDAGTKPQRVSPDQPQRIYRPACYADARRTFPLLEKPAPVLPARPRQYCRRHEWWWSTHREETAEVWPAALRCGCCTFRALRKACLRPFGGEVPDCGSDERICFRLVIGTLFDMHSSTACNRDQRNVLPKEHRLSWGLNGDALVERQG